MADFDQQKMYCLSSGFGEDNAKRIFSYVDTENLIADLKASGFFNDSIPPLRANDLIYIVGSDDRELVYVSAVGPTTVVDLVSSSSATIPDGSITEAKLASAVAAKLLGTNNVAAANMASESIESTAIKDLNVTEGKLAAAVSAKLKVFSVLHTTTAAVSQSITATGVVAGDVVVATLHTAGATPVTILTAACGTDAVTVTMSADPSTDHILNVVVFKA